MPEALAQLADRRVDPATAEERSVAVRTLLAHPLLVADADADAFTLVARHRAWLVAWFEETCGWGLHVDVPARTARLTKRCARPDVTRPARRSRGANLPFDRRRYELLARLCAELATHRVTTIGLLAGALEAEGAGSFESGLQRERAAFVDALRLLASWGVVRFEGGSVEGYVGDRSGNALVVVEGARLHRLLAPPVPASRVETSTTADAAEHLRAEPRYVSRDDEPSDSAGDGWRRARHSMARRLLDDPAVHLGELDGEERAYLASPSGRRWLRERVAQAGFVLEERAEGLLAVDPDAIATDVRFPAPGSTAKQVALLLVEELLVGFGGARSPTPRTFAQLGSAVARLLAAHPAWAKDFQGGDGAARLAAAAVDVLASLRLVQVDGDVVTPNPCLARYAVARADGTLL